MARKKTTTKRKTAGSKTKKTAKRASARKTQARRPARKSAAKKPTLKVGKTPLKKSEIYSYIAEATELTKKEISAVFEVLGNIIHEHLKKSGPGEFILPGLLKCKVQRKPATKARKGINPFTGEETMFKAKPARNVVKVRPLKKLKEMVK